MKYIKNGIFASFFILCTSVMANEALFESAKQHLTAACNIWETMQDQAGLMRGHGNLGYLCIETSEFVDAIYHSRIALELAQMSGEESLAGSFAANLTLGYLKTDKIKQAKEFAEFTEKIFKTYSDKLGLAQIWHT